MHVSKSLRTGRVLAAIAVAAALLTSLLPATAHATGATVLMSQDFQALTTGKAWHEGSVHGRLESVYNGYGSVGVVNSGSKVLSLKPRKSTADDETHAALVTSKNDYGDLDYSLRAKTVAQLRSPSPNTWETAWAVWHYTDNTHFYYLILKPNGWELGKEDPRYPGAQRFLATGSTKFPIGAWSSIEILQQGATIDVTVDGQSLTHFVDQERPYLHGAVGMYCEDSKAYFDDVSVLEPPAA